MGRIGRRYPRFPSAAPGASPPPARAALRARLLGAIIGLLAAVGLIGWLLHR